MNKDKPAENGAQPSEQAEAQKLEKVSDIAIALAKTFDMMARRMQGTRVHSRAHDATRKSTYGLFIKTITMLEYVPAMDRASALLVDFVTNTTFDTHRDGAQVVISKERLAEFKIAMADLGVK